MRTVLAPFCAFGVDMGSHLARSLDGTGLGGPV